MIDPRRNARKAVPCDLAICQVFPPRVWICIVFMLIAQLLAYYATRLLIAHMPLHDLTTPLDARIPFIPVWVTVYFFAYISWVVSGLWILSESPAHCYRCTCAYTLAMLLAGITFLLYPGTIARPDIVGEGFFLNWVRRLYQIDAPVNLCPSLHVLTSYFCWRGTLDCRRIPHWFRWFSFVLCILVSLSILFVKQHAVIDIPAALLVAELSLQMAGKLCLERIPLSLEHRIREKNRRKDS